MSRAAEPWFQMLNLESPADPDAIIEFETTAGFALPGDYAQFLRKSNGGWGEIGEHYLQLWPVEELMARNEGYNVAECAPGLLLFGSDGGGEAFAFDRQRLGSPVVMVPFIPLDRNEAIDLAPTFDEFLERLLHEPDLWGDKAPRPVLDPVSEDAPSVPPYRPGQPGPWPAASLGAYLGHCRARFQTAQTELTRGYGIEAFSTHRYDSDAGRLDFLEGDRVALSFEVLPIGYWSPWGLTWRWAWDIQDMPLAVTRRLEPLSQLEHDQHWPFFDRPQFKARLDDAWFMAMLALDVLGGQGVYRTAETPEMFLLLTGLVADNR